MIYRKIKLIVLEVLVVLTRNSLLFFIYKYIYDFNLKNLGIIGNSIKKLLQTFSSKNVLFEISFLKSKLQRK